MYQAFYRKYRPMDFDSVVGQDSIIKTLKNSISNHTFSHAYMFFGPRGTGKTTVSKIFARDVNCLDFKDGIACGKCNNCQYSFSKDCVDIIEIDAASNNGVDEIRELRNKITLVPSNLKYKVYIIDEVHMLSIGAFNALLKTLEEPPEHAIFILATTDPQKVPDTIISRCQCFSFKRISNNIIKERLEFVCKEENISIDSDVLDNIALLAEGGLRDALGLLDKLVSYCENDSKITMNSFIEINGIVSENDLYNLLNSIFSADISTVLNLIHEFDLNGRNLLQITLQLLNYSRNMVVDYYLNHKKIEFSIDVLQEFTNLLNEKMFDIKKAENVRIYIEMLLLKFMNDTCGKSNRFVDTEVNKVSSYSNSEVKSNIEEKKEEHSTSNDLVENINKHTTQISDSEKKNSSVSEPLKSESKKIVNINEIIDVRINNTLATANKELLKEEKTLFNKLNDYTFDQNYGYIACILLDSTIRAVGSNNFIISFGYESVVDQNLDILLNINDVYNKITNSNKKIAIVSDKRWNELKKEYINNIKNNNSYEIKKEPEVLFEESDKNDIISNSAIDLFGDIVEIE